MDLYEDLDFVDFALIPSTSDVPRKDIEYENMKKELQSLKNKLEQLELQNAILRKNISCLFKTAKREVQRKEALVFSQRKMIQSLEAKIRTSS